MVAMYVEGEISESLYSIEISIFDPSPKSKYETANMSNEIEINLIIREAKRLMELKFNEITLGQINHKLIKDQVFTTPLHDYHKIS